MLSNSLFIKKINVTGLIFLLRQAIINNQKHQ
jgi:hypothetical protein